MLSSHDMFKRIHETNGKMKRRKTALKRRKTALKRRNFFQWFQRRSEISQVLARLAVKTLEVVLLTLATG